ncbi:MAG: hypothetical protein M1824_002945 [Vezdaea acicularis]|nr:MAG: hypothetical protein M1824_002945 [Vezdaea acicularis]
MATSPKRSQFANPASSGHTSLLNPPSPRVQRTIRKFQSAHSLSTAANAPSLIAQQRQQLRTVSSSIHKDSSYHREKDRERGREPLRHNNLENILPGTNSRHGRSRSNSDAAVMAQGTGMPTASERRRQMGAKRGVVMGGQGKGASLEGFLREGPPNGDVLKGLEEMRISVLMDGVGSDGDGMSKLRIYIWLIFLNAPPLATDEYLALIHRGPSSAYSKIRNDTFRTLATDPLFRRRVSEASLIRLLNAISWKLHDEREEKLIISASRPSALSSNAEPRAFKGDRTATTEGSEPGVAEPGSYVQGMNVLAAPFLYAARSEAEAFVAFHRFLTQQCPAYVRGAMDGVHRGLALVDKILAIVDPKLSAFLSSKGMHAELYAFPSVLTLCACTPPLPEVLHLWDFLFAWGPHLNILCIVAQLILIRDEILGSPRQASPRSFTFSSSDQEIVQ